MYILSKDLTFGRYQVKYYYYMDSVQFHAPVWSTENLREDELASFLNKRLLVSNQVQSAIDIVRDTNYKSYLEDNGRLLPSPTRKEPDYARERVHLFQTKEFN